MNFFEQQDQTRRNTRVLVVFFVLAALCIVVAVDLVVAMAVRSLSGEAFLLAWPDLEWLLAHPGTVAVSSLCTVAFIAAASLAKTVSLRAGGGAVARALGGVRVTSADPDPTHTRLRNVVEEMAIASGVPVPEVYVMPEEPGINAFAAGFEVGDAAIGVTDGCARRLTRAELQGVIAHEFSHILNGDMRLNMNLMGFLHGILLIGVTGGTILRSLSRARIGGSGRGGGQALLVIVAMGGLLWVIGYLGVFFGRLIKAGVSRQREFLADASAVQFTRDPGGISGALKKIGGFLEGSRIGAGEEISHMLFGANRSALVRWMATHPPLEERIRCLDPSFTPDEFARIRAGVAAIEEPAPVSDLAGRGDEIIQLTPAGVVRAVGNPRVEHLEYAVGLLQAIPEPVRAAVESPTGASALVFALLLGDGAVRAAQLARIGQRFGAQAVDAVEPLVPLVRQLGPAQRLPLVDLALPALRRQPATEVRPLLETVEALVQADRRLTLFEYVLTRVLAAHLRGATAPPAGVRWRPAVVLADRRVEVYTLLSVVAEVGAADPEAARAAFDAGIRRLPRAAWPAYAPVEAWSDGLDRALARLDDLAAAHKRRVVESLVAVIASDGWATIAECELLRAICETLHCPLPPLAARVQTAEGPAPA